ncbi:MAG: hypothetical protein ACTIKT_15195 [Microbacterium sp.]
MAHTLIEHVDQPFDASLPFYVPGPLTDALWRFTSGHLTGPGGKIPEARSDVGDRDVLTPADGGVTLVRASLAGKTNFPTMQFGGGALSKAKTNAINPSQGTIYTVFARTPQSVGTSMMMMNFGGAFIQINSSNRVQLRGASGSVQTPTAPITTAKRYAAAFWWSAGGWGVEIDGAIGSGTISMGPMTGLNLGGYSSAGYFDGLIYEAVGFGVQHSNTQRAQQLAALKSFYGAA